LSDPGIKILNDSIVASFRSPDRCAIAVKSLVKYHQLVEKNAGTIEIRYTPDDSIDLDRARAILDTTDTSLSEHQSKELLKLYGISVTIERLVNSPQEAISVAKEIGFPVVLKIDSPDILHKSEADVIRLGISSREEIVTCYEELIENALRYDSQARINGVVVQEMIQGGTEVITGMTLDPQFGPTIAFGLGGIFVEVLKDISLRVTPLSESDVKFMVREIKGYPILNGIRGKARADIEAVEELLLKLSRLAEDWKDYIAEIDINPLIVFDEGQGLKALDALVVLKNKVKE